MVDGDQDDQKAKTKAETEADQLLLDWQQRFDGRGIDFLLEVGRCHQVSLDAGQLASGGLKPLKNSHEINSPTQITNPNRLTT